MKIGIYRDDELVGTGESSGNDEIRWEGHMGKLNSIASFYQQKTGLIGEALLRYLTERLNSRWLAREIEPGELPELLREKVQNPEPEKK